MENNFIIQHIPSSPEWKKIFNIVLNHCDRFEVFFPDGHFNQDNPLMGGKLEFEKLEDTVSSLWNGINEGICISGTLTKDSMELIYKLEEPSFNGDKPELWHFKLFKNDKLYLTIEDFTFCFLEQHKELILLFEKNGIANSAFDQS